MGTARSVHAARQDVMLSRRVVGALGQSRQSPFFAGRMPMLPRGVVESWD